MSSLWELLLGTKSDYRTRRLAWRTMRQFAEPSRLAEEFDIEPHWLWSVAKQLAAKQSKAESVEAIKLLLTGHNEGHDERRCETVVLFPPGRSGAVPQTEAGTPRATACVSSQPGCGVGCPFCLTASLGYRGNLSTQQIVEQVYWAGVVARQYGRRLRNVVYMGMGEPLHNAAAVLESIAWLTAERGFGLSPRHITVSTAGVPSAMLQLARRFPRVRQALSLHSAEAQQRRELVPRAVGDLSALHRSVAAVNELQTQSVWIEVVLFDQLNDTLGHARKLVEFCRGLRIEVNLIPYNAAGNTATFAASPRQRREAFAGILREAGIRTTIRASLGATAEAACGQLTASH